MRVPMVAMGTVHMPFSMRVMGMLRVSRMVVCFGGRGFLLSAFLLRRLGLAGCPFK
jgi:hypothetical protein